MVYGSTKYGAVASAYGPLTRHMPKAKGGMDPDQERKQKQKELHSSLLEYTKRMDKIKQARIAISKSREHGRLRNLPKQRTKHKVVLPGLSELENNALSLTNKFISHAQWNSAANAAAEIIERTNEVLPVEGAIKSNIFSNDVQKLSESSPNSFCRYWRVLNDGVSVKHIPVLKTNDGVVYSTVSRPATINKPPESADKLEKKFKDTEEKVVKTDENGNILTQMTTQTFRKFHPGVLPKPGTKGPYRSKVTLHVSMPRMEGEFNSDEEGGDDGTDSCSIDLPNDGRDSRASNPADSPKATVIHYHKEGVSKETKVNKNKFEAVIHSNDPDIEKSDVATEKKATKVEHGVGVKEAKKTATNDKEEHLEKNVLDNEDSLTAVATNNGGNTVTKQEISNDAANAPSQHNHKGGNHFPCTDCSACNLEKEADTIKPQKTILKKNEKPLPEIPISSDPTAGMILPKKRRGSLQQVRLPGGTMKLGKVTYHRAYKVNVRPVPPHMKPLVGVTKPSEITLHDSFSDAVSRTNVLKEAERTLRFEKNRKENQERRKKFTDSTSNKLWQALCRHGRFLKECYTCRAVEEIRQRLKNHYNASEQQYQWNLLAKHERHLTQGIGVKKSKETIPADMSTPYRLSTMPNAPGHVVNAGDTRKPDGRPGGRVITDKEGGRANPQGLLPRQSSCNIIDPEGPESSHEETEEDSANKKVRFAEERIYDPMIGSYRQSAGGKGQVLLAPIKQ